MRRCSIDGATLLDPEGTLSGRARILIADDRIEAILPLEAERGSGSGSVGSAEDPDRAWPDAQRRDASGLLVAPGFVDLHFHGELLFAAPEHFGAALARASASMARHGTTAFLATTVTWPSDRLRDYVTRLAQQMTQLRHHAGARPIGLHLEGPWINPECAGAQPASAIRGYRPEDQEILDACGEFLAMVTLAPEIPGGDALIDALWTRGVIPALGHSRVEAAAVDELLRRGMTHVTHLFNAMGGAHHRQPGLAGAVLGARSPVSCDLICDGVHVAPELVRVAARCLGDGLSLITDRIDPAPPGEAGAAGADFGSGELVDDGHAWRLVSDGRLVGSRLMLDEAVRNAVSFGAMTRLEAIAAVTTRPARLLGREREIGTLRPGARADLVLLDDGLGVVETWLGGRPLDAGDAGPADTQAQQPPARRPAPAR